MDENHLHMMDEMLLTSSLAYWMKVIHTIPVTQLPPQLLPCGELPLLAIWGMFKVPHFCPSPHGQEL